MANNGRLPDVLVETSRKYMYAKRDRQVERADEELLKDIKQGFANGNPSGFAAIAIARALECFDDSVDDCDD